MTRFRIGLVAIAAVALLAAWALPASGQQNSAQLATVTVTAGKPSEFAFRLSKLRVPRGVVVFKVTNVGAIVHDFKISGKKTRNLSPGQSQTLRVTLTAGKKPFLCTVTGHAAAGMKGTLTVT
jgi:uncharacterized cupredoxin-like copper-binding protein